MTLPRPSSVLYLNNSTRMIGQKEYLYFLTLLSMKLLYCCRRVVSGGIVALWRANSTFRCSTKASRLVVDTSLCTLSTMENHSPATDQEFSASSEGRIVAMRLAPTPKGTRPMSLKLGLPPVM